MGEEGHKSDREAPPKRQYPAAYERVVPIAMALIAIAIVVLLGVIAVVALGLYPGG